MIKKDKKNNKLMSSIFCNKKKKSMWLTENIIWLTENIKLIAFKKGIIAQENLEGPCRQS